ncbi:MAG: AraC family transcriptional regulator [Chitinophagaceae bacterium]|nr:MAG: AraC family transcriptional regulator [Chitinophagaceae bacterium]
MRLELNEKSLDELQAVPDPREFLPRPACGTMRSFQDSKAGHLVVRTESFPVMNILEMNWQTADRDIMLSNKSQPDHVQVNFQLHGSMQTRFPGAEAPVNMVPATHNLIFCPEQGDFSMLKAKQELTLVHLSVNKKYFSDLIGCDDHWSEKAQYNLEHAVPFAGTDAPCSITPLMMQIIRRHQAMSEHGPVRRLMLQSGVLEILALQIGQFRSVNDSTCNMEQVYRIPDQDKQKLYQLKQYLELHFLEDHSLSALGKMILLNEFKLKKGFKLLFGETLFGFLKRLRMDHADNLLKNTGSTIEEVAFLLGYEHAHHFSAAYKKHFGLSPSLLSRKYRRASLKDKPAYI